MPDELRRYQPPTIPEPVGEPEMEMEEEQPEEQSGSKWEWIGSDKRPEAQEHSDGISDLMEVNEGDFDETDGVDDLVEVDFDRDILDANENGDIEDLVNVDMEDIMGSAPRRTRPAPRRAPSGRRTIRYIPPTSMGGTRG